MPTLRAGIWPHLPIETPRRMGPRFRGDDTVCCLRRVLLAHALDQRVLPIGQAAEPERQRIGTAIIHVAVELPGETHAAMDLDVVLGAMLERLRRADARGGGGFRQFAPVGRGRPGAVTAGRARRRPRAIPAW